MDNLKVAVFDTKSYEKPYYLNTPGLEFHFFENRLSEHTAGLCKGFQAIASFVNDDLNSQCLQLIKEQGCQIICLRSAGYNNVDMKAAKSLGIKVCRVPSYSPHSVAEFTLLQMLCLNRKIHRAYQRTRDLNFSLEGLVGTTLKGKTIGIIGTGQIGGAVIELLQGFDSKVLAYDQNINPKYSELPWVQYTTLDELFKQSDIISLHVPLNKQTHHLIDSKSLQMCKAGVALINTGRGGLVESQALVNGLKSNHIGGAALDVYEEEENYFFEDFSETGINDDTLARLVSFPNVLITSHQAYLTDVSLQRISEVTLESLSQWQQQQPLTHEIIG